MVTDIFNDIVHQFSNSLPPQLRDLKAELEIQLRQGLTNALGKLNLVTREEFDIQTKVLMNTRRQLEVLEQKLAMLEKLNEDVHLN